MNLMNSTPKISIVIPVYNGSNYLSQAIDSALAQTYSNIEIVVVNDGSNDGGETERIALSYGDKIRYFSKENGGVASALNRAIAEMTGDYFSWLSHDDLYTKDKVEKEIVALSKIGHDNAVIYSNYSVFTSNPENSTPRRSKGVPPEHFRYWLTVDNSLNGCTLLIPRSAFEKMGGFNESLRTTQDYDLWFRMAKEYSFVHIPEALVKSRSHPDQGSHTMTDIAMAECNDLLSNFIRELDPQEIMRATGKPLVRYYARMASRMFNRGFNEAGILAEQYAKQNSSKVATMIRNMKYLGNRFINRSRILLPLKIKIMIKVGILRLQALRRN